MMDKPQLILLWVE